MNQTNQKKSGGKGIIAIIAVVAVAALGVVIYNLPVLKEKRAYNKAMNSEYSHESFVYERDFPEGKHLEEVRWHKVSVTDNPEYIYEYAEAYLEEYPQGVYADRVCAKADSVLAIDLAHYAECDLSNADAAGVAFMQEMIKYMQKNAVRGICVELVPNIQVKNLGDYSYDVTMAVDQTYSDQPIRFRSNLVEMREQFEGEKLAKFEKELNEALEEGLGEAFSSGVVKVYRGEDCTPQMPKMKVTYTLKNQSVRIAGKEVPEIWVYSENSQPKKFLLGMTASYSVEMSIPGSPISYTFEESGDPGDQIETIESIDKAYSRMAERCFGQITDKFYGKLGISTKDKKDDKD